MNARRWKRYPAYRDSGVEWLGEVPAHWSHIAVKRAFEIINGSTPVTGNPSFWDGDIAWVTPSDLGKLVGGSVTETERSITAAGFESCGTTMLPAGSIIMSSRAAIGHIAIAGRELCTNQGCKGLRIQRADINSSYFFYQLKAAVPVLKAAGRGSTFLELSSTDLGPIPLAHPPLREQCVIADFLDRETERIDALIAKKEELIRLLEEKRASIVSRVVTRGLAPDVPFADSGIPSVGRVPAHWRIVRNKNILHEVQDPSPDGSEELLTVSHITGVTPRTEKDVTMFLAESNVGYPRVAPGDLVINTMWAWMGALGVARHHGIVSPAYGVYRFTDAGVLPEYYDAFYRTPAYVTEMTRFSTGVWSSRLRIYPDVFLSLRVVVPPNNEQRAILDHIKAATGDTDAVLARLTASVALLREQRQALITAAVTGQVDVRDELVEPPFLSTEAARPREDAHP